jgi:hypothetical protein
MIKRLLTNSYLLLLIINIFLISCGNSVGRKEILRVKSPDSLVDAVLIRMNVDATTSYGYMLYIVPSAEKPKVGNEVLRADNLISVTLDWKAPRYLEISYEKGRIFFFTNFWHSKEVQNFQYIVELRLVPLTKSYSLN